MLQVKKIPFTSYDLASDEDAKKLWRRKAPLCECRSYSDLIISYLNRFVRVGDQQNSSYLGYLLEVYTRGIMTNCTFLISTPPGLSPIRA